VEPGGGGRTRLLLEGGPPYTSDPNVGVADTRRKRKKRGKTFHPTKDGKVLFISHLLENENPPPHVSIRHISKRDRRGSFSLHSLRRRGGLAAPLLERKSRRGEKGKSIRLNRSFVIFMGKGGNF